MSDLTKYPKGDSEYAYEWVEQAGENADELRIGRDANGNVLADVDGVTVIEDLKVKDTSLVVKRGTKVKSIHLVEGDHDIDCKIDGIGCDAAQIGIREEGADVRVMACRDLFPWIVRSPIML